MKKTQCFLGLLIVLMLIACDSKKVFEDVYDFSEVGWNMDTIPSFTFEIENSQPKRVLLNVINSIEFKDQNLYVIYYLIGPNGDEVKSELINIQLFDAITGKPFGEGNSVFQHSVELLPQYKFDQTGEYTIKVAHYMREAYLKNVPSIGIRVERLVN